MKLFISFINCDGEMDLSWSLVLEEHCKLSSGSPKWIFSLSSTIFHMAEWSAFAYLQILGFFSRSKRSLNWKFLYWLNSGSGEVGKQWTMEFSSCLLLPRNVFVWFPSCKSGVLLSGQSEEREKLTFISRGRNLFDGHVPKARVPYL